MSDASGVGHMLSDAVPPLGREALLPFCEDPYETAVAVGQNEDPTPAMGRPNIGCRETCPLRIEPELGQVSKYGSDGGGLDGSPAALGGEQASDVFHEHESGSHVANDPHELAPQS